MLVLQLLDAYVFVGLLLFVLGFLLSRQKPQSMKLRCAALVTGLLGVVSWALALLLWMESRPAVTTPAQIPDPTYAESLSES